MDTLLDTELGNENVESGVENTNNASLTDDGAKLLGEVGDKETQEQVSRLLLRELGIALLAVDSKKSCQKS